MKDGDIWNCYEQGVVQKGPETVAFTKVKGHATDLMVEKGEATERDQKGNDRADKNADKGAAEGKKAMNILASFFASGKIPPSFLSKTVLAVANSMLRRSWAVLRTSVVLFP